MWWHGRSTNKRHQHFARNNVEIKLQDALSCTPNGDLPRPRPPHNIRVTQIQCVCNLCGIAGQANHANKHHTHSKAAIGQYARTPVGSWHKNHCILTGGSSKMEAFCCHLPLPLPLPFARFRYSCRLAFSKRSPSYWQLATAAPAPDDANHTELHWLCTWQSIVAIAIAIWMPIKVVH